jgi:hypothetical protein
MHLRRLTVGEARPLALPVMHNATMLGEPLLLGAKQRLGREGAGGHLSGERKIVQCERIIPAFVDEEQMHSYRDFAPAHKPVVPDRTEVKLCAPAASGK